MGNNLKNKILDTLQNLYRENINYIEETYKKTKFEYESDIDIWKNGILTYFNNIFNSKYREIQNYLNDIEKDIFNINENDDQQYKIQSNNVFTSKDIQNDYSEIIDYYKRYSVNYINDDDELENKTIGEFLEKVANISRKSYNDSNKFLQLLYNKFKNVESNYETIISSLEQFKIEFSSWIKNKNQLMDNSLENFIKNTNINEYLNEQKEEKTKIYLEKLYKDLLLLFFKCELSFPSITINFKKEEEFNFTKMKDLADNKGKGEKKINFVVFPSLISNGEFLQKGKQYVFTYFDDEKNKTFYLFQDLKMS